MNVAGSTGSYYYYVGLLAINLEYLSPPPLHNTAVGDGQGT
jgi:hypothetical protein